MSRVLERYFGHEACRFFNTFFSPFPRDVVCRRDKGDKSTPLDQFFITRSRPEFNQSRKSPVRINKIDFF